MIGKCLCGAVTLKAPRLQHVHACHCGMCRKWSGGPGLVVPCGPDIELSATENLATYRSSEWAERAFCARCGTHIYYKLLSTGDFYVPAGLFDDDGSFSMGEQIFIDRKPDWYSFANETPQLTEAEVFAMLAGDSN
ncbi:MAG: GFA family protein [Gammaproteobacteria bacterium]|nr:GFA family protein [Gammaproteobacteria bacterium]